MLVHSLFAATINGFFRGLGFRCDDCDPGIFRQIPGVGVSCPVDWRPADRRNASLTALAVDHYAFRTCHSYLTPFCLRVPAPTMLSIIYA